MPSVQGTDAFDHGFDVPADYDELFGSPAAVSSPLYQGRLNSLEVTSPGNEGVRKNYTGDLTRAWAAFPLRFDARPATDVVTLGFSAAGGASVGRLAISTIDGVYATGTGGSATTKPVSTGAFHWIEAIYDVSGSTHTLYWRVDGSDAAQLDYAHGSASTVDYNQLVSLSGNGTLTWYAGGYWSWGSAASSSDWLGEPSAPAAAPTLRRLMNPQRW